VINQSLVYAKNQSVVSGSIDRCVLSLFYKYSLVGAALIKWATDVAKKNRLVIAILNSDLGGAMRKESLTLGCERSGRYREDKVSKNIRVAANVRGTGRKKCECSFRLKGKKLPNDDDWMLEVVSSVHNHLTTDHLNGHSYISRLSEEEYSLLNDMLKSNV